MSRVRFGNWGVQLAQEDFAQAVAAAGVLGIDPALPDRVAIARALTKTRKSGRGIVPLKMAHLTRLCTITRDIRTRHAPHLSAERCGGRWRQFTAQWRTERPHNTPFLRLELHPAPGADSSSTPDPLWLLRLLQATDGMAVDSAYLRDDQPDRPIAWEWPLRLGLLGDARSADLAGAVAAIPWPHLVKVVELQGADDDCDILLLPDSLRAAVIRVLQHPRRLRADCVLVIGGAAVAGDRLRPLAATLRSEVLTGGVGIVAVDPDQTRPWLERLVEELSHDMPLDVALRRASAPADQDDQMEPPLLIASRRLAANAWLSSFATRFGEQLRRMAGAVPPTALGTLEDAASLLEHHAAGGMFTNESGGATDVERWRARLEERVGAPLHAERDGEPAARPGREERRVNYTISDVTDIEPTPVPDRLAPDHAYEMALYIGRPDQAVRSAPAPFPTERLPPSANGHWLDVSFVPLVRAASGRFHTAQQARLFLPAKGDSRPCRLSFRTHGVKEEYRARILISHENRVMQTLIFSSPLGPSDQPVALDIENVVAPGFDPAWQGRPFDAAIVVNHGSGGQAGFTTVIGTAVTFQEPRGLDKLVTEVKRLLSAEATFPDTHGRLDDPGLLRLFDDLASYGRSILKTLPVALHGGLPDGARIQIVEARSGAWLPVEILYSSRLPNPGATLCPNARAALVREQGASHETCPHRDDPAHHCPLRFWGLTCVIERQAAQSTAAGVDYTISVPRAGADRLDALATALVGASNKVRPEDLTDPGGIVDAVKRTTRSAKMVTDWTAWESAVATDSPSLLMLLPHSQEDPQRPGIPGLEIGGILLTYPQLESTHVAGPAASAPVVLLLGCSTQLTEVPFLNFVEAFKREKAALVIGTLASIRGRRTVAFVSGLLDGLKAVAGSQRTFGDVFLETRRTLLAGGDGFVLSLTAYGDVGWRI